MVSAMRQFPLFVLLITSHSLWYVTVTMPEAAASTFSTTHPYSNNEYLTQEFYFEGALGLNITFNRDSWLDVTEGDDSFSLCYDANCKSVRAVYTNDIFPYAGNELYFETDYMKVVFESDAWGVDWGIEMTVEPICKTKHKISFYTIYSLTLVLLVV